MSDRLFTPRFLTMFGFSFTVFVSLFQLLPSAPYRVIALGGSTAAAGLFLGLLTYASALSAPLTGSIVDRIGQRRVLISVSLILAACAASYAVITSYRLMFLVVTIQGLFWSALLSASSAYMAGAIPETRRAEGLGYWGLASVIAIAVAPPLGFWVYRTGWTPLCMEIATLNLVMTGIAWRLPDDRGPHHAVVDHPPLRPSAMVEWRVLWLAVSIGLVSFGYGALTTFSALFADALRISPRSLFLTTMAVAILTGRLALGRALDRLGHRRVLLPCLLLPCAGLAVLSATSGWWTFAAAAALFGLGFGLMYPSFAAYAIAHVAPQRRGAAFGAIVAAFDTGIGTGSTFLGVLVRWWGYRPAFLAAAAIAALALPYFVLAERRLGFRNHPISPRETR